jgi:hypothetical protein
MATQLVDEHADFDATLLKGVGVSSRLVFRTLARNMRAKLASGERVGEVALATERTGWGDAATDGRSGGRLVTFLLYAALGLVLAGVLDVAWPVLTALLIAVILEAAWQWRRGRAGRRSLRALVMVTDRRVIEGVHPDKFREVPLERVNDVEVSSDSPGFATVRVQAASGDREIHVVSDWPKRGARAGAEAVAEAIRQGISPEVSPRRE